MVHTLSHLNLTGPSMWGPSLFAVIALGILNYKFDTECLLQHRVVLDLLLHCELKFDPATVGLRPQEFSI